MATSKKHRGIVVYPPMTMSDLLSVAEWLAEQLEEKTKNGELDAQKLSVQAAVSSAERLTNSIRIAQRYVIRQPAEPNPGSDTAADNIEPNVALTVTKKETH